MIVDNSVIERIKKYEEILDRAEHEVRQNESAIAANDQLKADLNALEDYYTSSEWKEDYEADEKGLLPDDLKRGVLSQDGIDHLLDYLDANDSNSEKEI